jgi:peptide/nickel transport system substrate-binding protein
MTHYDDGEWITLERNPDWWGIADGVRYPVKTVRLLVYQDPEMPFTKLLAGELSISGLSPPKYKKYILDEKDPKSPFKDGRLVSYTGLRPIYRFIGWKNRDPRFRDPKVRRALAMACDVNSMLEKIWLGILVPMSNPVYPGSPSADPDLKPVEYDPKAAAKMLDEAGWAINPETGIREKTIDGKVVKFEFELIWNAPAPDAEATINQCRNDLRAVGVLLNPVPLEWSLYLERLHDRAYDAALAGWGTDSWDQDFDQVWHSKGIDIPKSSNTIEYSNPEVDRLSDQLRTEMDVEKRKEIARRIGRIIYEDQPCLFLGWANVRGVHWNWLKNSVEHAYKIRPFIRSLPMWVDR